VAVHLKAGPGRTTNLRHGLLQASFISSPRH
jgi:hypothetical protein